MESEAPRAEDGGDARRIRRGALFKLAVLAGVLAPVLVFLLASQRNPFGLSLGPPAPLGKVAPQLINTLADIGLLLAPDGSLWCWGSADFPNTGLVEELSETPQRIGTDRDWCRVAASHSDALALKTDGSLWGWGWNGFGAATQARSRERVTQPTRIGTNTDWTQIAAGAGHCLALKRDSSLWAWGQNDHGQVGDGTTSNQFVVTRIGPDHDWSAIAAGDFNSFALKLDGTLWGWGIAHVSGRSAADLSPQLIDSAGNVVAISANDYFLLALRSDGTLWICGVNAHVTAWAYVSAPARALVQIGKAADWKEVYAGRRFFFARKRNGSWWVCGQCKCPPRGAPPLWSSPLLASPRRSPLRFEPWALAPGLGDALLLTRDGTLWNLSVGPDTSRSALRLARLKALVNQTLASLPGHRQPFDLKEFRIVPTVRKLWELPPDMRPHAAIQNLRQPVIAGAAGGKIRA
jgi:alpha-tubulin suppressor-like RCC1 family protein